MSQLWIDASVGLAGDMLLAALVDAGADRDRIAEGLRAVVPDEDWQIAFEDVRRGAFRGLWLRHDRAKTGHGHRPWRDIRERLSTADLPQRARQRALAAYERLAVAEAQLHGVDVETVELHEVGAVDSILDLVGVCLALEDLDVERVMCTPLPLGTGAVDTAHGSIPLPAPATLAVLQGFETAPSRWPGEWVTPTGAALASTLATVAAVPAGRIAAVGHGAGTRDPDFVANLVRVVLIDAGVAVAPLDVVELSANLDDIPGEHVPPLVDALLDAGALDAWATPIVMKRGRPGLTVSVLARPADADVLADVLMRHSPTLGVRWNARHRRVLQRWEVTVSTRFGDVRIKLAGRDGEVWHGKPEFADVARLATEHGVSVGVVHQAALAALEAQT